MDTTIAAYFSVIAAILVAGGILYQVRNYDTVTKAPREITPSGDHHH
ncbi:hypothetical protein DCCM_2693 [Desulfocucumis palustris]|uniref:Uncharacterized protein n=1 Tax=Desulfocucumis palustris TaxID=1898651 RepID=A0A2L2XBB3_9FIRM|nr:hypothetical protein [Desulfocucumis palustris]GBF33587.1 hypothetical protein DCCM_2693 [Desulfocucumis palustris]